MAQVWVARQHGKHGFAKLFAVKAIHQRFADDPQFRAMFLDEARIVSAIEHPNVAQVFDLGEHGSMLYLVMEYVDGESLASILSSMGKKSGKSAIVPTGVALRIVADACAGLHAAHRLSDAGGNLRGVVHRDVSPQNILLSAKGDVKLIDFGIAHAKDRLGADTDVGSLKGKLHYMAPEQAKREPLGPHTDVFSIGATLYRMLAGRPVYEGPNEAATLAMLMAGDPPRPLPEGVPPLVAAVVMRALEPDPGDRYPTALGMQTAVEAAIVEEGFVPDVATFVNDNASPRYRDRKEQLTARAAKPTVPPPVSVVPDLPVPPPRKSAPSAPEAPPPPPKPKPDRPREPPRGAPIMTFTAALTEPEPPPEAPRDESVERSFMDVKALAARRSDPILEAEKPPLAGGPKPEEAKDGEKPKPKPAAAKKKEEPPLAAKSASWIKLAVAVVVLVLLASAALLLLPMIVRDRILANAREAGIDLAIDGVGVSTSGVTLRGVTMHIPTIQGVEVKADEVFASGFSAAKVRVSSPSVTIDGSAQDVGARLVRFYQQDHSRFAGSAAEPRHVSIVGARVAWTRPFGEGTRVDASDVGAELDSKGVDDLRTSVGRFEVKTKKTTLGPWSASFDQAGGSSRARVLFDPALPDGPSALYVFGADVVPKVTVRIPRAPLAQLGVRPDELALPADPSTELEAKIEGGTTPSQRIEVTFKIDLWSARVKLWKSPVDIHLDGLASGLPGKPLELDHTTATVGPFKAGVTGTVTPDSDSVRLDVAWRTVPIACQTLVKAEAKSVGPLVATLQELAQKLGAARVTGNAQAVGIVKYDTRTPDDASFTITTKESCGLSIFGL